MAVNFVAEGKESTSLNKIEVNCGVTITPLPGIVHVHKAWDMNENMKTKLDRNSNNNITSTR